MNQPGLPATSSIISHAEDGIAEWQILDTPSGERAAWPACAVPAPTKLQLRRIDDGQLRPGQLTDELDHVLRPARAVAGLAVPVCYSACNCDPLRGFIGVQH